MIVIIGPPDPLGAPSVPYLSDLVTESADRALVDFIEIGSRLGWPLFAPPEVPEDRIEALRAAFAELADDPVFKADFESTVQAQLDPRTGAELAVIVECALATPTSTLEAAKTILGLD